MNQYPLAVQWVGDAEGTLRLIDQTKLPEAVVLLDCQDVDTVWEAIKMLRVRGAPAIGVTAAYGLVVGVRQASPDSPAACQERIREVDAYLRTSRPTAVNLFWALDRMQRKAAEVATAQPAEQLAALLAEAHAIREEDREMCVAIGQHGAALMPAGGGVLTHCNTGALATADFGTAFSVLLHAHQGGKGIHVFIDETRPLMQGSRLTAWECLARGIPATLLCDNMAATLMREGKVQAAVVGADRIAANGDTANKIGTYGVAVLAKAHGVPFYVAAPSSTFDLAIASGSDIPIEHRDPREITHGYGRQTAPDGIDVYNPAFDVTPADLITAFFTERGVIEPPFEANIRTTLGAS